MTLRSTFKILLFGFLLFFAINILLFVLSLATASESTEFPPANHLWAGIVLALLVTGCSWWLARRFKLSTAKEALTYGIGGAIVVVLFLLFITIPNQTTGKVFSEWSTYLVFVGIAVGPSLWKLRATVSSPSV